DLGTFWRWERDVAGMEHESIDVRPTSGGAERGGADRGGSRMPVLAELATAETDGADAQLEREERVTVLRDAILALKEQQRVVLSLYYFEELPMAQIAPVLGVTESRVCQIHKKALRALRETLHAPMGQAA